MIDMGSLSVFVPVVQLLKPKCTNQYLQALSQIYPLKFDKRNVFFYPIKIWMSAIERVLNASE